MDAGQYYQRVIDQLRNCYRHSGHIIATGEELAWESEDPVFPSVYIANILCDLYQNPEHNWVQVFFRHPAEEKSNFWACTYSAVALFKTVGIRV